MMIAQTNVNSVGHHVNGGVNGGVGLRGPGGKRKASSLLHALAPLHYREYREPFVFTAGMLWRVGPGMKAWINDRNPAIGNFWRAFRDDDSFIWQMLEEDEMDQCLPETRRGRFEACKPRYREANDPLAYWYLNRHSHGGIVSRCRRDIASFSPCQRNKVTLTLERLESHRAFLRSMDLSITTGDYEQVLFAPGEDAWIFLDPPYFLDGPVLYDTEWTWKDQERLAGLLKSCKHNWMMTNTDCNRIRRLYKDCIIQRRRYTGALPNRATDRFRTEIIITNYRA